MDSHRQFLLFNLVLGHLVALLFNQHTIQPKYPLISRPDNLQYSQLVYLHIDLQINQLRVLVNSHQRILPVNLLSSHSVFPLGSRPLVQVTFLQLNPRDSLAVNHLVGLVFRHRGNQLLNLPMSPGLILYKI